MDLQPGVYTEQATTAFETNNGSLYLILKTNETVPSTDHGQSWCRIISIEQRMDAKHSTFDPKARRNLNDNWNQEIPHQPLA